MMVDGSDERKTADTSPNDTIADELPLDGFGGQSADFQHTQDVRTSYQVTDESFPDLPPVGETPDLTPPALRRPPSLPATKEVAVNTFAGNEGYVTLDMHSGSSYKIRGGGHQGKKNSPLLTIILALIIIVALAVIGYSLYNILGSLATSDDEQIFTLSADETRSKIDETTPVLIDLMVLKPEEAKASLIERGYSLLDNTRYITESPDITASGTEVICIPEGITEDDLLGYYEGSFNAYTPEELQKIFNGTWILDLTQGDNGKLFKLKYANLAAKSIEDEIYQIQSLVGLTGDDVTISKSGDDSMGNTFSQGTKVIKGEESDTTYYWRVAACPLDEIYYIQSIPETATYLTVTIAEYDFISSIS